MKLLLLLPILCLLVGCRGSTIETRRQEKLSAYTGLSPEMKQFVDGGQVRVGMPMDAVYIAWGQPQQILEQESGDGHTVIWQYHATYLQETRYWNFREVSRDGTVFLDRYLDHAYDPREYVSAEIVFQSGKVKSWRTLPRPPQ